MANAERCVCCGEIIPEGRMVCPNCEVGGKGKRLIDVDAFRKFWNKNYRHQYANDNFLVAIANFPTVDAVSRGVHDQVRWERDVAIEQLESYGVSLGEKAEVVKLPYKPTPLLKDYNPHNTDAYCPECGTNLSGYFGGEPLPIVTCYVCGEIINPYMAMTKDELAKWRKDNDK